MKIVKKFISKRIPSGFYDNDIVCLECEKTFGIWDQYGIEFLTKKTFSKKTTTNGSKTLDIIEVEFDYPKLKMFLLSVLWRAHHSKQPFFNKINIGPHEKGIRDMIIENDPRTSDDYSVILVKYDDDTWKDFALDPDKTKFGPINCFRLYFGGYMSVIKVDQRPITSKLKDLVLSPDRMAIILLRNFKDCKEFGAMKNLAKKYSHLHQKP